jgi:hypothetical protein
MWITASAAVDRIPDDAQHLSGTWHAELLKDGERVATTLDVPGLFLHQGFLQTRTYGSAGRFASMTMAPTPFD